MQNKNGVMPIGIIGIIVIVLSISAFFLIDIERSVINGLAFTFLLLSELGLFGGLIGLRFIGDNHSKVFINAGATTALVLYFIATLISTLIAGAFRENLNTFILIQIIIIALFAIIMISVFAFSRRIADSNKKDILKVGNNTPKRGGF